MEALGWAQRGGAKEILPATHEYPAIFLEAQGAETVAQCALARGGGSDKQHVLAWQIGALESLASCESSSSIHHAPYGCELCSWARLESWTGWFQPLGPVYDMYSPSTNFPLFLYLMCGQML